MFYFTVNFVVLFFAAGQGRAMSMLMLQLVEDFQSSITFTSVGIALQLVAISLSCKSILTLRRFCGKRYEYEI